MRPNFHILTLVLLAPLSGLAQETVTEGKKLIHDIFVMDASGDNALRITDGTSIVQDPSWSPNGQLIAFSLGTTEGLDIWVMSPDGRESRAVTELAGDEISPSWSADGSTIAFCSVDDGLISASIKAVSLNGGNPQSLTDTSPLVEPNFSPSGARLLVTKFVDPEPRRYSFTLSILENGALTDIETPQVSSFLTQGSWSPNGGSIVCRANKIGLGDIGILTLSDATYFQLTSHPAEDRDPTFSPDGRNIVFSSDRSGDFDLYRINVDGTGLEALTQTPDQDELEPAFSPDGQRIAYTVIRLATTEEEATALETDLTLPESLQAGRNLPDDDYRLSPWRLGLVWRTSHDSKFLLLGSNGELIGTRDNDIHPDGNVLYFVRDGNGALLHHSGPMWRGYYARIESDGTVIRKYPEQPPGTVAPPSAEYDQWPFRDETDRIASIPENETLFPRDTESRFRMRRPRNSIGWVIRLATGGLLVPNQEQPPQTNVIWVIRKNEQLELIHSGPTRNGTFATVLSDRTLRISELQHETFYWLYEYANGKPALPPQGFVIPESHTDPQPMTVLPNGRVSGPGMIVP